MLRVRESLARDHIGELVKLLIPDPGLLVGGKMLILAQAEQKKA